MNCWMLGEKALKIIAIEVKNIRGESCRKKAVCKRAGLVLLQCFY